MNNIKAVILDLDGTLLDDNKKISNTTIEFLKQIKEDIKIIPASARQFCTIKPYLEKLDLLNEDNYTICFNGSLIVNNKESEIFSSYIDKNVVVKIDDFILENKIDWTYYLYDNRLLRNEIGNINEFVTSEVTFVADTVNRPDILEVVTRKASALLGRSISVKVVDMSARPSGNPRMEQLVNFSKAHSDIVSIKEH